MTFREYVSVVIARWQLILATVVVVVVAVVMLGGQAQPVYQARAEMFFTIPSLGQGSDGSTGLAEQISVHVKAYAQLANSEIVTAPVYQRVGVADDSNDGISLHVGPVGNIPVLDVAASSPSGQLARELVTETTREIVSQVGILADAGDGHLQFSTATEADLVEGPPVKTPTRNVALGLIAGAVLGYGFALLLHLRDRGSRVGVRELRAISGVRLYESAATATVPEDGSVTATHRNDELAAILTARQRDEGLRSFSFVPASDNDVEFVVLGISQALVRSMYSVALVSAVGQSGLTATGPDSTMATDLRDLLGADAALEVSHTARSGLVVIRTAQDDAQDDATFASPRMATLVTRLSGEFDFVLLASGPLSRRTAGTALALFADETIVVVAQNATSTRQVEHARDVLGQTARGTIGVVPV
ncbi:MAG: hypothetical protein ACYC1Z_03260 [Georgenia sp.]